MKYAVLLLINFITRLSQYVHTSRYKSRKYLQKLQLVLCGLYNQHELDLHSVKVGKRVQLTATSVFLTDATYEV